MALCFLLDRFKAVITKYGSSFNRTQQYPTEVKYLKYQPELITWYFGPTKGFTESV
jgi:hypothetical protein